MASRTEVTLIDDLNGDVATVHVLFRWEGVDWEIDLSDKHYRELADLIRPYVDVARRVKPTTTKPHRPGRSNAKPEVQAMRAWAISEGYEVGIRGRIAQDIVKAYQDALINHP